MVEKKMTTIPAIVDDKVGNPVSNTTLPLGLGHIKHDYYGSDFWTPIIVLLSLSIPGILCLYVMIYYMGNRIIQLSSTQRSYEPVSTNVDLTMRLNDVEKQFLLCQRKMEEKEQMEKQKRVRVATHPGQLLVRVAAPRRQYWWPDWEWWRASLPAYPHPAGVSGLPAYYYLYSCSSAVWAWLDWWR
jgi:hypothetical protein